MIENYGYIIKLGSNGFFAPQGKIRKDLTDKDIEEHNKELDNQAIERLKSGLGSCLYIVEIENELKIQTWASNFNFKPEYFKYSNHNLAGKNGRIDVWFKIGNDLIHGVNIGDNQILRCKKIKSK